MPRETRNNTTYILVVATSAEDFQRIRQTVMAARENIFTFRQFIRLPRTQEVPITVLRSTSVPLVVFSSNFGFLSADEINSAIDTINAIPSRSDTVRLPRWGSFGWRNLLLSGVIQNSENNLIRIASGMDCLNEDAFFIDPPGRANEGEENSVSAAVSMPDDSQHSHIHISRDDNESEPVEQMINLVVAYNQRQYQQYVDSLFRELNSRSNCSYVFVNEARIGSISLSPNDPWSVTFVGQWTDIVFPYLMSSIQGIREAQIRGGYSSEGLMVPFNTTFYRRCRRLSFDLDDNVLRFYPPSRYEFPTGMSNGSEFSGGVAVTCSAGYSNSTQENTITTYNRCDIAPHGDDVNHSCFDYNNSRAISWSSASGTTASRYSNLRNSVLVNELEARDAAINRMRNQLDFIANDRRRTSRIRNRAAHTLAAESGDRVIWHSIPGNTNVRYVLHNRDSGDAYLWDNELNQFVLIASGAAGRRWISLLGSEGAEVDRSGG